MFSAGQEDFAALQRQLVGRSGSINISSLRNLWTGVSKRALCCANLGDRTLVRRRNEEK
jgi:hypothetical protein